MSIAIGQARQASIERLSIAFAFAIKFALSLTTVGTDDAARWYGFFVHLSNYGGRSLYQQIDLFNHPPFMIHVLRIVGALAEATGLPFYFWLRLPAILADIGSVAIASQLLRSQARQRSAPTALVLLALAPASIMISGFHGNTDPVMLFFVLLAVYLIDIQENAWLAGIAFGMSMNIKVAPAMFLPAFLLYLPSTRKRLAFLALASATFVVAGLPYIVQEPLLVAARVFGYGSIYGEWGVPRLLRLLSTAFTAFEPLNMAYASYGKWLLLALIAGASAWMNWRTHKPALLVQCGFVTAVFLVLTPGFGVQYLVWLVPWLCIGVELQLIYYFTSGLFLFLIYTAWSRGLPWYYASSFFVSGPLIYVGLLCWLAVVVVLAMYYRRFFSGSASARTQAEPEKGFGEAKPPQTPP